jgi:hypothetical protein
MTWTASVADFLLKRVRPCGIETKTVTVKTKPPEPSCSSKQRNAPIVRTQGFFPSSIIGYYHPNQSRLHWTGPLMRAWINTFKPIIEELPPDIVGDWAIQE